MTAAALNSHGGTHVALNAVLLPAQGEGQVPEWIEILPAGAYVQGRDGRAWVNDEPQALVEAFGSNGADLPVDWEHSTERLAPQGQEAPAAGWIKEVQIRPDGSLWGRVEWTPRGAQDVASKAYRYISPVFDYRTDSGRITALRSAALTNQPNLHLTALNQKEPETVDPRLKALLQALGLAETATEAEVTAAFAKLQATDPVKAQEIQAKADEAQAAADAARAEVETLKAENARLKAGADPNLSTFVPRADYDALKGRLETAENSLRKIQDDAQKEATETALNQAIKDGKIAPASRDYYARQCAKPGGLDEFRAFCQAAPSIAPAAVAGGGAPTPGTDGLTESQRAICSAMGLTPEAFLKSAK